MSGNITTIRRQVKNVAYNFSEAQVKVREATSNDPWGPSSSLMSEIADLTYNAMAFSDCMQMIWKRLNDHGKNWRHVYKSLVLLDYLIKTGSDKVAQQCKENIYAIQTLKDFQHMEENKDQGMNVREKAKQLVSLLKDDERLKNERARALMAKKRFAQNSMGISSDGSTHHMRRSGTFQDEESGAVSSTNGRRRRDSEFEEARPTSSGEEELQLQIALALSKEEAQKEEDMRKGDHVRLQMALSESKQKYDTDVSKAKASERESALDELFSLQPPTGGAAPSSDPWGGAMASGGGAAVGGSIMDDPWAPSPGTLPPPASTHHHPPASSDPWAAPPAVNSTGGFQDPWAPDSNGATGSTNGGTAFGGPPPAQQNGSSLATPPPSYGSVIGGTGDAWDFDPMSSSLPGTEQGAGALVDRNKTKTPENFLGENSALVNLDNLMGPSKPVGPTSTNPFAAGTPGAAAQPRVTPNPFLAQQRPSPTLNQMRAQNTIGPTGQQQIQQDWNLPAPLEPVSNNAAPGSHNPFL